MIDFDSLTLFVIPDRIKKHELKHDPGITYCSIIIIRVSNINIGSNDQNTNKSNFCQRR